MAMAVDDYMRRNGTIFWGGIYSDDQRQSQRHGMVEPFLGYNKSSWLPVFELEGAKRVRMPRDFQQKTILRRKPMGTKSFTKQFMQEVVWNERDDVEVLVNKIVDVGRWSIAYELVFKYQDVCYASGYSRGATEQQDEAPFEFDDDMIECTVVVPVEKKVIEYVKKEG